MLGCPRGILALWMHGEYRIGQQHTDQDPSATILCPCMRRERSAPSAFFLNRSRAVVTFMILGSAKTSFNICKSCRQGFKVSIIQFSSLVLICINDTKPTYDRASWCSRSTAISFAVLSTVSISRTPSKVSTNMALVSSTS